MKEGICKIGRVKPKRSSEIKSSRIGLGFEKLDRDAFDPERVYEKVNETGVKWARIQSGWEKTERVRGVYDFEWLDRVVDRFLSYKITPWICLCYGNPLYTESAKKVFGSVGCPPIFTLEEKEAWRQYVTAAALHFKGRGVYYEVWNEPDGQWCWRHGPNAEELGVFTRDTARYIHAAYPDAKVIGGSVCLRNPEYLNDALRTGMGKEIDYISYHEYTPDETKVLETVENYRALARQYNPKLEIIQGESGSQSRMGGRGALHTLAWTEEKQAKQLARHTMADLISDVFFTSYFSCVDMAEAMGGIRGDKTTYRDFGYFGVLGMRFDENGEAVGEYQYKKSYIALQTVCSVFADEWEKAAIPVMFFPKEVSPLTDTREVERNRLITASFRKKSGEAFVYWLPSDLMTTSFEGFTTVRVYTPYRRFSLIDMTDGSIYALPAADITDLGGGMWQIENLPVADYPLLLTMGEFYAE